MASYSARYKLDASDPAFPRIVRVEKPHHFGIDEGGDGLVTFNEAKRQLIETIRYQRDHWVNRLRDAKALTIESIT
jgi:hypothetical protein